MSFPIQNKNRRKQSKYVVNLSLDIPVESDRFAIDKPVSGQFTIFPTHNHKNMKLKLGSARTTQQPQSRRITVAADSNRINSARNDKKITPNKSSNKSSAIHMKHTRHTSCLHSKSPSRVLNKATKESLFNNQPFNMKILKNKIIYAVDDDIIGYTSPSAELQKEQSLQNFRNRFNKILVGKCRQMRSELITPPLQAFKLTQSDEIDLLSEIKKMEKNAIERKNKVSLEYILRKILVQSCARKIQRAWRNYKTKKLLHAYSQSFSLKFTNKMRDLNASGSLISQKKVLNVKSCGYKNGQSELKMKFKQQRFQPQEKQIKQDQQQKSTRKNQINELQKQLQLEEIQKWEELIKQLRKNKDVQEILHKAQQNKSELQLKNNREMEKEENRLISSISKIENQESKKQIQEALSALQGKQVKQKKESEKKWFNLIKINTFDGQVEEQSISPKSEIIEKIQITYDKNQKQKSNNSQNNEFFHIRLSPQIKSEETHPQQIDSFPKNQAPLQQQKSPKQSPYKKIYKSQNHNKKQQLKKNLRQKLLKYAKNKNRFANKLKYVEYELIKDIVCELLEKQYEQFTQSYLHKKIIQEKEQQVLKQPSKDQNKQQGICTNMQSIKDYLQNLISFIFEQYPGQLIQAFNTPIGYNSTQILQLHHRLKQPIKMNPPVMDRQLFEIHWGYASQQIYFQQKYDARQLELERVQRLKRITKIFFHSIFDGFNECLSYQRIYGIRGQPYIWQTEPNSQDTIVNSIEDIKPKIKSSFKRLSEQASTFCGMLVQDKCKQLAPQLQQDIKEQRMNVYLEYEIKNSNHTWQKTRVERSFIQLQLSHIIFEELMIEMGLDIYR